MNAAFVVAVLLASGVLWGIVRSLRDARPRGYARSALQLLAGVALWYGLFPPTVDEAVDASTLVVLTPGADRVGRPALPRASRTVALPGAPAPRSVERVPDLATALRRHPDVRRLHVVGGGLPARDLDVARGRVAGFDAAPLPAGVVELDAPAEVAPGARWRITGRLEGLPGARVELLDPSGAAVATASPDDEGRFGLDAQAKGEGRVAFVLRVTDAAGAQREHLALPLRVRGGQPLRMRVFAGAPDAELKYLRRWAADAGIDLHSRIRLSEGIALTEGDAALDAASLGEVDLVVIDERAWVQLAATERAALRHAVEQGLGLLLRITGPVDDAVAADWAALGFRIEASAASTAVSLATDATHAAPMLARQPVEVSADAAAPLLQGNDGVVLGRWRALGQGRVGTWWLADSFRLVLGGDAPRHAALWATTTSTLARARGARPPALPTDARVDERAVLCHVAEGAQIESPAGERVGIVPMASARGGACAAYWPAQAGWHVLHAGGERWPFHVRAADEAPALVAAANARATRALVGGDAPAVVAQQAVPLPRWPFLLAWLAVAGLLWWLERDRGSHATT